MSLERLYLPRIIIAMEPLHIKTSLSRMSTELSVYSTGSSNVCFSTSLEAVNVEGEAAAIQNFLRAITYTARDSFRHLANFTIKIH